MTSVILTKDEYNPEIGNESVQYKVSCLSRTMDVAVDKSQRAATGTTNDILFTLVVDDGEKYRFD